MGLSKSSQLIESIFAGGGEMGARMRAVDWSTTVLGPVEQWPQSQAEGNLQRHVHRRRDDAEGRGRGEESEPPEYRLLG